MWADHTFNYILKIGTFSVKDALHTKKYEKVERLLYGDNNLATIT